MGTTLHQFYVPVLGIGYSIDTPVKVAHLGISSVLSIVDDDIIEKMRAYYCQKNNIVYTPITTQELDYRALRITSYLNLIDELVYKKTEEVRQMSFSEENDLTQYFKLLPQASPLKKMYQKMLNLPDCGEKELLQLELRKAIVAGSIDVNVMAKVDRTPYDKTGKPLAPEYSEASASLRGFAHSTLRSSIVFSAGYNPRLYSYIEHFSDFFPDKNGNIKKKIILKVSDFRSALVQGKVLAKKGLWISEFRIESGLNCGGHVFPTDGYLLGPILEEFKQNREKLRLELYELCNAANTAKGNPIFPVIPEMRIAAQGGIGTAHEHRFLLEYYGLDSTGWGSPFLLVPEATNVDEKTLQQLAHAKPEDFYISNASPLGVAFNNFKPSSAHNQIHERIQKNRPGSPCYKKFLVSNTEFTDTPICTASREYQNLKIKQLDEKKLSPEEYQKAYDRITEKDCLCEGLSAGTLVKNEMPLNHKLSAITICPGPNLAYFSGVFSLSEMVNHIYGHINILNSLPRPNLFSNELRMYVNHFKTKLEETFSMDAKQVKYLQNFKANLLSGISYYQHLISSTIDEKANVIWAGMEEELAQALNQLQLTQIKEIH